MFWVLIRTASSISIQNICFYEENGKNYPRIIISPLANRDCSSLFAYDIRVLFLLCTASNFCSNGSDPHLDGELMGYTFYIWLATLRLAIIYVILRYHQVSRALLKRVFGHMWTTKAQISLRIRAV